MHQSKTIQPTFRLRIAALGWITIQKDTKFKIHSQTYFLYLATQGDYYDMRSVMSKNLE